MYNVRLGGTCVQSLELNGVSRLILRICVLNGVRRTRPALAEGDSYTVHALQQCVSDVMAQTSVIENCDMCMCSTLSNRCTK